MDISCLVCKLIEFFLGIPNVNWLKNSERSLLPRNIKYKILQKNSYGQWHPSLIPPNPALVRPRVKTSFNMERDVYLQ